MKRVLDTRGDAAKEAMMRTGDLHLVFSLGEPRNDRRGGVGDAGAL